MRITQFLTYYVHRYRVPGQLYGGKHRKLRNITERIKYGVVKNLIDEQKNIEAISNPYLTEEEDHGHTNALGADYIKLQNIIHKQRLERMEKRWPNKTSEGHFTHLKTTKSWE